MPKRKNFKPKNYVLSSPTSDYPLLVGIIFDIKEPDDPDRETENEDTDIYVNFSDVMEIERYSESRICDLNEHFRQLYQDPEKTYEDVPLDYIILSPDELITITRDEYEKHLPAITNDKQKAAELYNKWENEQAKEIVKFTDLNYGDLFTVNGKPDEIWCKTPKADMYQYDNRYSEDGAFCTAVRVNSKKETYMQCNPQAECIKIPAN